MLQMLQDDRSRGSAGEASPHDEDQGDLGEMVKRALDFLRRQYLLILAGAVLGLAVSVVYLAATPPTYIAQSRMLLENPKRQFTQQQSILADAPLDAVQIESQLQILKSRGVLLSVINQLNLVQDPDFQPSQPYSRLMERAGVFAGAAVPQRTVVPVSVGVEDILAALEDRLTIGRVGLSNVIEIKYSSSSPKRAAEVANAVAAAYIRDKLDGKSESSRTANTWLQKRLHDLSEQALAAERALDGFRAQNNIVAVDGKLIDEQQAADLNTRVVAARAQTSEALTRLKKFEKIIRERDADLIAKNANLDATVADALNNPIINALRQQYLEYARKEADWSVRLGRDHVAVATLRTRIRDVRTSILDEVRRLAETSKNEYEAAKQRQEDLEKQLAEALSRSQAKNSAELTLRELEADAKGYRSLYESFLQRYMGSVQQESFPITDAHIISPASPPQSKSKPKNNIVLALGLFAGLAFGGGMGFFREIMDPAFRTTQQVESLLQMPCLSLVPKLKDVDPRPQLMSQPGGRTISRSAAVHWGATEMPLSRFAESIRSIKLGVDLNAVGTLNKVVGITSALPGEGKSTIAAALAMLMAHAGARVIVVDCDLRNPSLSRQLAPEASVGLVEVASGKVLLQDAIWIDPKTNLALLPTAKTAPLIHTSEMLSAARTKQLFENLRVSYDYVVVDLPPLAPIVDVRTTVPLVDCFVLVVEWASTRTDVVLHALHTAPNLRETLVGAVLNKADMKVVKRYERYCGDYYSEKHGSRYGIVP